MVRLANREDDEIYAVVEKVLGNNQLKVKCLDGVTRHCKIRGKFTGKKKEFVHVDSWVLVGIHTYETNPKCSLLEIYNDKEIHDLKMTNENWSVFGVEQEQEPIPDIETIKKESVVLDDTFNFDDI